MLTKGLVQVYTGNGKGKTTASLGLAVRAAGWGNSVIIYQFLKPAMLKVGERKAIAKSKLPIKIVPLAIKWNMRKSASDLKMLADTREKINKTFKKIIVQASENKFDVIILDEIVFCLSAKLVDLHTIKELIDSKSKQVELILTGRGASKELIKLADLVTEMKMVKHPFSKNMNARKGIEF